MTKLWWIVVLIAANLIVWMAQSRAHDSWISRGLLKNQAGEYCCGDFDCKAYNDVASTPQGWIVDGQLVPYDEALPLAPPDGSQVTVCRRMDGSRRCVFGLKPGL